MKLKWKEEAVSPVIATILMVAITVVLAAVLYLMVVGIAGNGGTLTTAPVGSWQSMTAETNRSARMVFGNIQPELDVNDAKIIIEDENGNMFNISWPSSVDSANFTLACDDPNISAFYFDYNPTVGQVGSGDYIVLYGLEVHTYYYVEIFYYPSDSIVGMAGDNSFQTFV